jgi:hypothetical protein
MSKDRAWRKLQKLRDLTVSGRTAPLRKRRRQFVIALRNLQVPKYRIPDGRDLIDVGDGGYAMGVRVAHRLLKMT